MGHQLSHVSTLPKICVHRFVAHAQVVIIEHRRWAKDRWQTCVPLDTVLDNSFSKLFCISRIFDDFTVFWSTKTEFTPNCDNNLTHVRYIGTAGLLAYLQVWVARWKKLSRLFKNELSAKLSRKSFKIGIENISALGCAISHICASKRAAPNAEPQVRLMIMKHEQSPPFGSVHK